MKLAYPIIKKWKLFINISLFKKEVGYMVGFGFISFCRQDKSAIVDIKDFK